MCTFLPKNFRVRLLCTAVFGVSATIVPAAPSALSREAAIETATEDLNGKDYDAAVRVLAPVLEANAHDPELINLKGAILTKQNKFDEARRCFTQALEISPGLFAARYNLGSLLALQHQWNQAIDYYRTLLLDQPNNELVEYKLLLLLLHEDADPELQSKLFDTDLPTNTPAWYYATAARCYKKGKPAEAEKYLEVARNVFADKTAIFQEELDESGLNKSK
jgi:tetratricopeptide (TPR) repeat protein